MGLYTYNRVIELLDDAQREGRCCSPDSRSLRDAMRYRSADIAEPVKGLFLWREAWERLEPPEKTLHLMRALAPLHPTWRFCGASAGVFANAEGGLKGCLVGSFLHGLLITFLPAICMPVMGSLNVANCTFSDSDFSVFGIIFGNLAQFIQGGGLFAICVVCFLLPIIYNFVAPKKAKTNA